MSLAMPSWSRFSRISHNRMVLFAGVGGFLCFQQSLEFLPMTGDGRNQLWSASPGGQVGPWPITLPGKNGVRFFSPCHQLVSGWNSDSLIDTLLGLQVVILSLQVLANIEFLIIVNA